MMRRLTSLMLLCAPVSATTHVPAAEGALHEIHSTLTVARRDAEGLDLRIRVFADDLARIVAEHAGRAVPADSSVQEHDLARYVQAHLVATDAGGARVPLTSCGRQRVREIYLLCYRSARTDRPVVTLRNSLLTDLHDDQGNVVQVVGARARRSLLLTRDAPDASLGSR